MHPVTNLTPRVDRRRSPAAAAVALTLLLVAQLAVAAAPSSALPDQELASRVRARVAELAAKDEFSGVVLVAREGRPVVEVAVGMANRSTGTPVTPDTRFNVGSITKLMTRIIIQKLAREGRLALDEPFGRVLPDYPDREIAARVTPRQLLEMSSGLGDFFGDAFESAAKDRIRELADYLPFFAGRPLEFEPGTDRRYSNAGFIVLGLMIEKIYGEPYRDVVQREVFDVAGMRDSAFLASDEIAPRVATGYTRDGWMRGGEVPLGPLRSNVTILPGRGSSAGGSYSTARDLVALDRAIATGRFLPPGTPPPPPGANGVAGGTNGANAALESDSGRGWTIVVLANLDPPAAESLTREIAVWCGFPSNEERPQRR